MHAGVSGSGRTQEGLSPPSATATQGSEQSLLTMGHPLGSTGHGML